MTPEVLKMLVAYSWPGNVRELENEIKKLLLLTDENSPIKQEVVSSKISSLIKNTEDKQAKMVEATEEIIFDDNYSLYDYLSHHEKRFIIKALKEKSGIKKHAAELLNIPESTLRLKIKQYNIDLKNLDVC